MVEMDGEEEIGMPTRVSPEEADLVERAKTSPAAFHQLYVTHLSGLYRYAYYRTGNQVQAEDIVAQTFLLVWQGLPRYQQRGIPFSHWLFRIAGNVLVKYQRKQQGHGLRWDPEDQPIAGSATEQAEMRLDLLRWLRTLPDSQQQVLALRYVQDLSLHEVAKIMGKSEGAVKQLAWRGLSTLRERMGNYAEELGD